MDTRSILIPFCLFDDILARQLDPARRYELAIHLIAEGIMVTAIDVGYAGKFIKHTPSDAETRIEI